MKFITVPGLLILVSTLKITAQASDSISIENLVFKGAGIRGIAYCGAIEELAFRGELNSLKRVAGTSSGAIIACLLAVGYAPSEIFEIVGETKIQLFNEGGYVFIGGIFRTAQNFGWYRGDRLHSWVEGLIEVKTGNRNTTFQQLSTLSQRENGFLELTVCATSLNQQCTVFLSAETFPNMRIADAVRASVAIPLYFQPVLIDENGKCVARNKMKSSGHILVDGGVTAIFPLHVFDCNGTNMSTIGLHVETDEQAARDFKDGKLVPIEIDNTQDFVFALYNIMKEQAYRQLMTPDDFKRTIAIDDAGIGPRVKRLSEQQKFKLMECGRKAVRLYYGEEIEIN